MRRWRPSNQTWPRCVSAVAGGETVASGSQRPERARPLRGQQRGQLLWVKAGQGRVERATDQGGELLAKQAVLPACGLVAFVVHEAVGPCLGPTQSVRDDDRHARKAELCGGKQARVAG